MLVNLTESGLFKVNNSMFVVDGSPEEGFELTKDLIFMLDLVAKQDFTLATQFDFPKKVIHIVVTKEEAEMLTSLNAKGSYDEGFYVTVEFCHEYQLGMPVGTTSIATGYYQLWHEGSQQYIIVEEPTLTVIR